MGSPGLGMCSDSFLEVVRSVATEFAGLRLMPLHLVCDQHGNTPLHLCAIWDLEHMYDCLVDLLSETRSSKFVRMWQCVANNDGHSPLLLAAFMGQKVILSHLLEKKTVMCWEYGTVKCMALNVDGIDEPHGALSDLTHRSKKALSETFIRHAGAKKTMAAVRVMPCFYPMLPYAQSCFLRTTV